MHKYFQLLHDLAGCPQKSCMTGDVIASVSLSTYTTPHRTCQTIYPCCRPTYSSLWPIKLRWQFGSPHLWYVAEACFFSKTMALGQIAPSVIAIIHGTNALKNKKKVLRVVILCDDLRTREKELHLRRRISTILRLQCIFFE